MDILIQIFVKILIVRLCFAIHMLTLNANDSYQLTYMLCICEVQLKALIYFRNYLQNEVYLKDLYKYECK